MTIHDITTKHCAECGKEISILHPDQWAYKETTGKSFRFWCSWGCMRKAEKEGKTRMKKLTLLNKKEAVRIAVEGGNPLEFIRMCGISNAAESWSKIKSDLKEKDPDTWAKLPKRLPHPNSVKEDGKAEPDGAEIAKQIPVVKVDGPIRIEAKQPGEIQITGPRKPVNYDGFDVMAVNGRFGRYSYQKMEWDGMKEYIDFESFDRDELHMPVEHWREFIDELKRAAKVLGVEL